MNKWKPTNVMSYYYRESDGRVLGSVWHYALSTDVYSAKIFAEDFPFTNESEKYLGHFVDKRSAELAVEKFWLQQENTLEFTKPC